MKKGFFIFALLLLFLFSGCISEQGGKAAAPQNEAGPAVDYREYADAKSAAFDSITMALMNDPDAFMELEPKIMSAGTADMSVLPLAVLDGKEETIKHLESLLFTDVKVNSSGQGYTVSYKGPDGEDYVQAVTYDASLNALQSSVKDGGGIETAFFEYIKTADGYIAQYYLGGEEQNNWVAVHIGKEAAIGVSTLGGKPESLTQSADLGLQFVKKCEAYFILEGETLTVFDNGQTKQINE